MTPADVCDDNVRIVLQVKGAFYGVIAVVTLMAIWATVRAGWRRAMKLIREA